MCSIMEQLNVYVPKETTTLCLSLPNGETKRVDCELYHQLLLGGDQLTATHARSSCAARCDHDANERLYVAFYQ